VTSHPTVGSSGLAPVRYALGGRGAARGGATLTDWLTPDHIAWSVRHSRELLPTERIRPATQPRELPEQIDPSLLHLTIEAHDGGIALSELLQDRERDALVALRGGRIVLEWLAPGVRPDEEHLLFSVTKAVTGTLACALASRGLLDPSAPAVDVVPEVAGSAMADTTIRQLMDMEASFSFVEDYSPGPDVRAYRDAAGWYPAPPRTPTLKQYLATREPDGPHGERFRYLSPTIDLLGWACANAAGTTWAEAVETHLWQPSGAESPAHVTLDREGTARAAGGLSARPRALARFGLLVAERRTDVLSEQLIDDILRGGHREQWARGDFASMWAEGAYRAGWYAPNIDPDVVLGIGIHGQMLYIDVPRQVVVVLMSSWSSPDDEDWHLDNHAVCRTLASALA
jgi:CubicO group peptidase (beta-lactamase class C family)